MICAENNIEYRLPKPVAPKTNGMLERVNQTIKKETILWNKYNNIEKMNENSNALLFNNNFLSSGVLSLLEKNYNNRYK